ncbi:hypothetical protein ABE504_09685 [Paenibacillus oryzisoli]|uniref:hypothetical protein n=1 Tax=Paenibacillus oryzisoli TaxID=1850517 RepID=UPI003D2D68B4
MLEAVADQVEASGELAKHIGENLGVIAAHQRVLLQRVTGLPVRTRSQSAPGKPWVNAQLQLPASPRARPQPVQQAKPVKRAEAKREGAARGRR